MFMGIVEVERAVVTGNLILRASAGRYEDPRVAHISDTDLISETHRELAEMMDISDSPMQSGVTRWHDAFPSVHGWPPEPFTSH